MADYNSVQMTAPRYPVSGPGIGGRSIKIERGEIDLGTGVAAGKTISMFKLHPRFRVVGGFVKSAGLGAGVTVNVGDAADPDRYFAGAAVATASTVTTLAETGRDYLNGKYEEVIATIGGAATGTAGKLVVVLEGYIEEPA